MPRIGFLNAGEVEIHEGGKLVQVLLCIPAETVARGQAASEHVILEHVVEPNP
jgi:hypothetical protein